MVQLGRARGGGQERERQVDTSNLEAFAKFLNRCLLGTRLAYEDTSSTESSLKVLGETFSMASFTQVEKIPLMTPFGFEQLFHRYLLNEVLSLCQHYMEFSAPTLTLQRARGFNCSPYTTIKLNTLSYKNQ